MCLGYYEISDDPIDVLVEWEWTTEDLSEPLSVETVTYYFPPIGLIQQRYRDASKWCTENCKGRWWHGRNAVTYHFEIAEDATLFILHWGGHRLTDWMSKHKHLISKSDRNPSRKI